MMAVLAEGDAELTQGLNSISLGDRNTPSNEYKILAMNVLGFPQMETQDTKIIGRDGSIFSTRDRYVSRSAVLDILIKPSDGLMSTAYTRYQDLAQVAAIWDAGVTQILDVWLPGDTAPKRLTGRVRGLTAPDFGRGGARSVILVSLRFDANRAVMTGTSVNSQTISDGSTVFITNAGTGAAYPTFSLSTPTNGGTVTIHNTTTGEKIVLTDGSATETIVIDVENATATGSSGTDFYPNVDQSQTTWFRIVPGSNSISYTAPGTGSVLTVQWYDSWL